MAHGNDLTKPRNFRLNDDEWAQYEKYCQEHGTERGKLTAKIVREIITNKPHLVGEELIAFRDATRQLSGIARNLNQITRKINSGDLPKRLYDETYFKMILQSVSELNDKLDYYVEHSANRWVK